MQHLQASIIVRRKESKAEELQEAREELATAERELRQRSSEAQAPNGEEVVRGDEVKSPSYCHCYKQYYQALKGDLFICMIIFDSY